jgi:uncharacterized membrane protein YeaQ/YmgE (transglycosylase-associated protein family)
MGPIADPDRIVRSVTGICVLVGSTVGGFVPELWGSSSLSLASLLFATVGGVVGVWFGVRLSA